MADGRNRNCQRCRVTKIRQDKQGKSGDAGKVLERIQKLPSLPSLVIEILASLNDEHVDVATLANKIARDQAIVARVLRVANSPFFGLSGQTGSIFEAVAVLVYCFTLGGKNLRGLVTAAAIINALPRTEKGFDWRAFWHHGIVTAVCAKVLARRAGLNPETAFTAGLLHDIGKLMMGCIPRKLSRRHFSSTMAARSNRCRRNGRRSAPAMRLLAARWQSAGIFRRRSSRRSNCITRRHRRAGTDLDGCHLHCQPVRPCAGRWMHPGGQGGASRRSGTGAARARQRRAGSAGR